MAQQASKRGFAITLMVCRTIYVTMTARMVMMMVAPVVMVVLHARGILPIRKQLVEIIKQKSSIHS